MKVLSITYNRRLHGMVQHAPSALKPGAACAARHLPQSARSPLIDRGGVFKQTELLLNNCTIHSTAISQLATICDDWAWTPRPPVQSKSACSCPHQPSRSCRSWCIRISAKRKDPQRDELTSWNRRIRVHFTISGERARMMMEQQIAARFRRLSHELGKRARRQISKSSATRSRS